MSDQETMRRLAWDSYFAGVMSISLHPKAGPSGARSTKECAEIADAMLYERDLRFPLEKK